MEDSVIAKYHNTKEDMVLDLRNDTDRILNVIDLDDMLNDPSNYLELLGKAFMDKHQDKFIKAFNLGSKFGKAMQ